MNKIEKKILILLAMAQLILTLDTTVMNVSISTLVVDLNTTISGVQSAITFYTLVMAAFMIAGAKVGDIIGRKKAFVIGLCIYGTGSLITALAPNITVLKIGWSLLEGLGAALIIPAMISLIASNFDAGTRRVKAYGTVAAMGAIGAGIGPLVGGFLTTYASWRYAFAAEVIVVLYILFKRKIIVDSKLDKVKPKLDWLGVGLIAAGMVLVVQGILYASTYGLIYARQDYEVNGQVLISTGSISPTVWFILFGLITLSVFVLWERHREKKKLYPLIHLELFKNKVVNSGNGSVFATQFLLGGTMYALALFLQIQLQYDALQTGIAMLPLSLMILVTASRGSVMSTKFAPRKIVQTGFGLVLAGAILLGIRSSSADSGWALVPSLVFIGSGIGMIFSQLQNLVQSAVTTKDSAEASGLFATFQNLGMSFGTAISGVLLVGTLLIASTNAIDANATLSSSQKDQLKNAYNTQAQIVSDAQIQEATASQPAEVSQAVVDINAEARQKALSSTFILLAVISGLGLLATINLPANKPGPKALG
ncbi:MAG TPA: MFS transporter [Candidatus Saccharibacteria bacterium]|nr:MFS transporter [Candidatus Saccharibacteria bacterium]HMT39622.1 MFS transporter [Candidatus Saccharibacteria bacterium]